MRMDAAEKSAHKYLLENVCLSRWPNDDHSSFNSVSSFSPKNLGNNQFSNISAVSKKDHTILHSKI